MAKVLLDMGADSAQEGFYVLNSGYQYRGNANDFALDVREKNLSQDLVQRIQKELKGKYEVNICKILLTELTLLFSNYISTYQS